jgi:hypothetical protein
VPAAGEGRGAREASSGTRRGGGVAPSSAFATAADRVVERRGRGVPVRRRAPRPRRRRGAARATVMGSGIRTYPAGPSRRARRGPPRLAALTPGARGCRVRRPPRRARRPRPHAPTPMPVHAPDGVELLPPASETPSRRPACSRPTRSRSWPTSSGGSVIGGASCWPNAAPGRPGSRRASARRSEPTTTPPAPPTGAWRRRRPTWSGGAWRSRARSSAR